MYYDSVRNFKSSFNYFCLELNMYVEKTSRKSVNIMAARPGEVGEGGGVGEGVAKGRGVQGEGGMGRGWRGCHAVWPPCLV